MNGTLQHFDCYGLTVDIDWSPDFWIDELAATFKEHGLKCTWYITHDSPAVRRLLQEPLFECGIHPNFLAHSSHGNTEDEIIRHCLSIVEGSKAVRTHALFMSSRVLYKFLEEYHFRTDSSLFMPNTAGLQPFHIRYKPDAPYLIRIPYQWEDDVECLNFENNWDVKSKALHTPGLKIFNFHPVYFGLNSRTMNSYEEMKVLAGTRGGLPNITPDDAVKYTEQGYGTRNFLSDLAALLTKTEIPVLKQCEIADRYNAWIK